MTILGLSSTTNQNSKGPGSSGSSQSTGGAKNTYGKVVQVIMVLTPPTSKGIIISLPLPITSMKLCCPFSEPTGLPPVLQKVLPQELFILREVIFPLYSHKHWFASFHLCDLSFKTRGFVYHRVLLLCHLRSSLVILLTKCRSI